MGNPYYGHMRMHKLPPKKTESASVPGDLLQVGQTVGIGGMDIAPSLNGELPPPQTTIVVRAAVESTDPLHVEHWGVILDPAAESIEFESVVDVPGDVVQEPVVNTRLPSTEPLQVDQWVSSIEPAGSIEFESAVVALPEPPTAPERTPVVEVWSPYWSKPKLMEYAVAQGIALPAGATKVEIVAALEAASNKQE